MASTQRQKMTFGGSVAGSSNVCLDWEASTDEQGLRVPDKQQRVHDLSGDDPPSTETACQAD